ncbi:AlbA family DNA-binding domain-containing protein [Neorhizobium tomejilense]|uniref:AlbA family DNA-binding domain-containing protein n=1 Tax=Neorhizobium tomejilense TaxID=2093828 RepID=UPI000CF9A95A|nr:ATP-binding protein [Neorhizobium tomejilense]
MATRNSLSSYEVSIIKALISTKDYSNQEIAGLVNRSRGAAATDVSSGRISNIKNNEIKKYVGIAAASKSDLSYFLAPKTPISAVGFDPFSDAELATIIRVKPTSTNQLDITETDRIECKKSVNIPMKTLAAFANNKGGYFVFGVENKTWEVHGIDATKFAELDFNKLNQNILSSLGVGLEIQKQVLDIAGRKVGILYVAPAHTKPVIMSQSGDGFSQGQIYFRYPGEDRLITQADLQRLIEDRIRQLSETVLSKHITNILKFGIENSAVLDLNTGLVDGKAGNFVIDPKLLPTLSFIKEGEFVDKSGSPTLKLIGEVTPSTVLVTTPQKLTELYPYSYRDLSKRVKDLLPSATDNIITRIIHERKLKQNEKLSVYNFRNKRQEDQYKKSNFLTVQTPSIYNDDAVAYIVNAISNSE